MNEEKHRLFIEKTFTDIDDGIYFLDHTVRQYATSGWEVCDGSGIRYVNHQWQVGVILDQEKKERTLNG